MKCIIGVAALSFIATLVALLRPDLTPQFLRSDPISYEGVEFDISSLEDGISSIVGSIEIDDMTTEEMWTYLLEKFPNAPDFIPNLESVLSISSTNDESPFEFLGHGVSHRIKLKAAVKAGGFEAEGSTTFDTVSQEDTDNSKYNVEFNMVDSSVLSMYEGQGSLEQSGTNGKSSRISYEIKMQPKKGLRFTTQAIQDRLRRVVPKNVRTFIDETKCTKNKKGYCKKVQEANNISLCADEGHGCDKSKDELTCCKNLKCMKVKGKRGKAEGFTCVAVDYDDLFPMPGATENE